MTRNTLTQEYVRALFDYRDGKLFWKSPRPKVRVGAEAGWITDTGRRELSIDCVKYKFHRVVFLWHRGWMPAEVDHVNRDPLDNRIENLRPLSHSDNNANNGASGVTFYKTKDGGRWRAQMTINYRWVHIGSFLTKDAAQQAYREAKARLRSNLKLD